MTARRKMLDKGERDCREFSVLSKFGMASLGSAFYVDRNPSEKDSEVRLQGVLLVMALSDRLNQTTGCTS